MIVMYHLYKTCVLSYIRGNVCRGQQHPSEGGSFTNEPVSLAVGIRNALRKFTHEPTVKDKDLLGTFIEMLTAHVKADLIDTSVIYDTLKESVPIKNPYIRISCVQMVREIDCFEFWHKIIVVGK